MLANLYPDDRERGNAMGIALGGLALGVLGESMLSFIYNVSIFARELKKTRIIDTVHCQRRRHIIQLLCSCNSKPQIISLNEFFDSMQTYFFA